MIGSSGRGLVVSLAILAASLVYLPAASGASVVTGDISDSLIGELIPELSFQDTTSEADDLTVRPANRGRAIRFVDGAGSLKARRGCLATSDRSAVCRISRKALILFVDIATKNGADEIETRVGNAFHYAAIVAIRSGSGDDLIRGGRGDESVVPGKGDDRFLGGRGFDNVLARPGDGRDIYRGGSRLDGLDYGAFSQPVKIDFVGGRAGPRHERDVISGFEAATTGSGDDHIFGDRKNNLLVARSGDDSIHAGAGGDVIDGGPGADHLFGGSGRDLIFALDHGGTDSVHCGPGRDVAFLSPGDIAHGCEVIRRGPAAEQGARSKERAARARFLPKAALFRHVLRH